MNFNINSKKFYTAGIVLILIGILLAAMLLPYMQEEEGQAPNGETTDIPETDAPAGSFEDLDRLYTSASNLMQFGGEVVTGGQAAVPLAMQPVASGTVVHKKNGGEIDASHLEDGYFMARYTGNAAKLMVLVTGPSGVRYQYLLNTDKAYETFPLSDGSGSYTVGIYRNVSGTKYATVQTVTLQVALKSEFAPFLLPNQYVNYTPESQTVLKAQLLTRPCKTELEKVQAVYSYVIKNITYDTAKAKTVQSGYLPDVDEILASGKGICFDYASLMAAMLRSQNIPTKLVVGYTGSVYHAWINVYTQESGWVEGVIFFDGSQWKLMDPTFASSGKGSAQIMAYIGNGSNYQAKYIY